MSIGDVQATFCATLVDEWVAGGVGHAVVAPGSRSTPMALALAGRDELALHVVHDERAAAFVALGLGLGGRPAVLLCTSGTAAANFLPAVVEAGLSEVPMVVVTADRPAELRDVGAPQTIDQTHLYGRAVTLVPRPGHRRPVAAGSWRSLARRVLDAARSGPVHLNLPFREPLVGTPGELPPAPAPAVGVVTGAITDLPPDLLLALDRPRGVIVAGGRGGADPGDVADLAEATGWPILADPLSGMRGLPGAIGAFDALLRHERFAADHRPEIVVRIGRPPASRVLAEWIARSRPLVVGIGGPGVIDPDHLRLGRLPASALRALAASTRGATGTPWGARWRHAGERAERAIEELLARQSTLTEPAIARTVADALADDAELVVASSMPVRDLEWFGGRRARPTPTGAPTASTAWCRRRSASLSPDVRRSPSSATSPSSTTPSALVALRSAPRRPPHRRRRQRRRGIFSFLPQAADLSPERFERLFGTPHGTDVVALARAHGLDAVTVADAPVDSPTDLAAPGPSVTRVPTDRVGQRRPPRQPRRRRRRRPRRPPGVAVECVRGAAVVYGLISAGEHRLELGLGLGQLGVGVGVGDDAAAGVSRARRPSSDSSAQRMVTAHVPLPCHVDPADGAPVVIPVDALDRLDERQRRVARVTASGRCRAQRPHQLDDVRTGDDSRPSICVARCDDVGDGDDRGVRLPVEEAAPRQERVVDDVDHDAVLHLVLRAGDERSGDRRVELEVTVRAPCRQRMRPDRPRRRPRRAARARRR